MLRLLAIVLLVLASACQPSSTRVSVWGEVPRQCTCRGEPLARVATDLQDAQLPVDFKIEEATEGLQLFSVSFDPGRVSTDRVRHVLEDAGAVIVPAPATP
jgi:hypothetical protein